MICRILLIPGRDYQIARHNGRAGRRMSLGDPLPRGSVNGLAGPAWRRRLRRGRHPSAATRQTTSGGHRVWKDSYGWRTCLPRGQGRHGHDDGRGARPSPGRPRPTPAGAGLDLLHRASLESLPGERASDRLTSFERVHPGPPPVASRVEGMACRFGTRLARDQWPPPVPHNH